MATPVTMPDDEPTVANVASLLLHVPPEGASVSVVDRPIQTWPAPEIEAGRLLTVTVVVAMQPEPRLYVITAVPPAIPVTTPVDELMITIVESLLLQAPPPTLLPSVAVEPTQTDVVPVIAAGVGSTVTVVLM